ncbi:DUF4956 domain-containing protein [Hyalangium rubrum]|uniref:DUF4956 domain-containing protein n=1 Tax=Hyalangium rubrum TaxID=3103134 RepID=A0ABU5H849_9BACT|nr:DUF4956 domain-containing protein [Hyalangium sp. s54d21]MDY7229284.1 DUF4956 domain-containing protein [Hyalangium sp. s54d21]
MPPLETALQGLDVSPHFLTIPALLERFTLALVLGAFLAYRPWRKLMPHVSPLPPKSVHTQVLIAVAGAVMTTVIGDSVSRAFGLVGLGGFIRFRSGIKDPRDAAVMFVMIGVGMACGLGAASVALCATAFFGAVLLVLDAVSEQRMELVKLSLGLEDVNAAVGPLRELHPQARFLALEQAAGSQGGTAVVELPVPSRTDGLELLQGLRSRLPGVRSASIDPD